MHSATYITFSQSGSHILGLPRAWHGPRTCGTVWKVFEENSCVVHNTEVWPHAPVEWPVSVHNLHSWLLTFQRLQNKILKLVDVSYGGENGFNQAIELSAEVLGNVKFIQEKKLIGKILIEADRK